MAAACPARGSVAGIDYEMGKTMKDLRGKVVLITGAARGMGKLHAANFAREGSVVVLTDVDEAELDKTV